MTPESNHQQTMRSSFRRLTGRPVVLALTLLSLIALCSLAPLALRFLTGLHQQSVAREIAGWGRQYTQIQNDQDAIRAVEILEYLRGYYVPDEGYRSFVRTEQELEEVRRISMNTITSALAEYSGENFGNDLAAWQLWSKNKQARRAPDIE